MKLTLKQVIELELIAVCKEKTESVRAGFLKLDGKRKFSQTKIDKVTAALRVHFSAESISKMMEAMSILHDAPELYPVLPALEFCSVVVLDACKSGHPYKMGAPHIVTRPNPVKMLYVDGQFDPGIIVTPADAMRAATDSEIEQCVKELTLAQWITITNPTGLFKDIVKSAMEREVSIDESGDGAKRNGDIIETSDRRISMS